MNEDHLSRIQIAISKFFKVKNLVNGVIRVSHGAQFSNSGSIFGFFLTLFLILIAIVFIIQGSYTISLIICLICPIIIGYILDFQGMEIDTVNVRIRNYRSFLGFRSGQWLNLNDFNKLMIYHDSILEKRSMDGGSNYSSSRIFDTHNFYTLYLVDYNEKHHIKLHEDESITRIRIFATKFSELSKLHYYYNNIVNNKPDVIGRWRIF
jgi:hypothetical protein